MKSIYRIATAILTSILFSLTTIGQTNRLYTTQQGLVTSDITSLCMDSHGLAWITGKNSIGYFDGNQFHYIPNINPETGHPYFGNAKGIKEDPNGNFWVLSNRGLFHFNIRTLQFKYINLREKENETGYAASQMLDIPGQKHLKLIITEGYGVFYFDAETQKVLVKETQKLQEAAGDGFIVCAGVDHKGRIWMDRIRKQMVCFDSKTFKEYKIGMTPEAHATISSSNVQDILEVRERKAIYFATRGGMLKYDEQTNEISLLPSTKGKNFRTILYTQNGELLAGSDSEGIWILDKNDNASRYEVRDLLFDLTLGKVTDMVQDNDGNIIVSLLQKGILVIPHRKDEFRYHAISLYGNDRNTSCITSIAIDSKKNYWIATDGAGIFTTNGLRMATAHPINEGLRSLQAQSIIIDRNDGVWVGTYGGGVQYLENGQFTSPAWLDIIHNANVKSMAYAPTHNLVFVATNGNGVFKIDPEKKTCTKVVLEGASDWTSSIYIDDDNTLWLGDVSQVYYYNAKSNLQRTIKREELQGIPSCFITIGKGTEKRVLIGTDDGILVHYPASGKSERILDGLSIASFNQTKDDIWAAATQTIFAIDKKTLHAVPYTSFGGFYVGELHQESTLNNGAGNMLFGCDNGIICFDPDAIRKQRKLTNTILFTSLYVNGQMVNYSDSTSYLDSDILYAKQITLPADENSFRITFSLPHLSSPGQMHYEYILEGYDKEWSRHTDCEASFSNLQSGNYTLRVRAYIEGDYSSAIEKTIRIHVNAPWYDTTLAHIIYLFIFAGLCFMAHKIIQSRREHQRELRDAHHNDEIKEAKLKLFTSIAHELRTPLTMIISPLKQLITLFENNMQNEEWATNDAQKENMSEILSNLNVMNHNCNRLLHIVKQITDIRKIDAGHFKLQFQETDICAYIRNIATSFLSVANIKDINFTVQDSERVINVWIDPLHFEKIVINILSNAFKFSPEGSRIAVRNEVRGNQLNISFFNSGPHINQEDLDHIYERFYQAGEGKHHTGSGIGLNLARELVNLHHGTITAHNVEPEGVEFIITLPLGNKHLSDSEISDTTQQDEEEELSLQEENRDSICTNVTDITTETETEEGAVNEKAPDKKPSLLIVDDNKDILDYLKSELQQDYAITLAFSGNSAWNMVLQSRPDVVLTDMMMEDGNGIELCQRIKGNPELDHIAVIMLTGEGDEKIELKSLELYVDHYLQKPFNISILKGVLKQVLQVRESMKKYIQRAGINNAYENIEMDSADDRLFARINKTLLAHLDDSEFGVQELSKEVGISRVHLNRKMKEKYGLSPNVFIRAYRIKQAAYLIARNRVNVSEVAYRVGFSNHSYFSSSFREYFGMSPTDFGLTYSHRVNDPEFRKLLE